MATVIAVHGTYAHLAGGGTADASVADLQWWQPGSAFEKDLRQLVEAKPGGLDEIDVQPFEWDGENSEISRRQAGSRLLEKMRALEARQEPYCVVGHSHGGSVMGWALLEGAARKEQLQHLKRWITVGTPFVSLQREHFLFARLDLMRKVIFVASFMLLFMFLVYLGADLLSGGRRLIGNTFPTVLFVTAAMMSLPILVFYFALKFMDSKTLLHYRRSVRTRASELFGTRWRSLTHTDDEAVQGLAFLPGAKLNFIDRSFAVSTLTMLSVFALPLIYLLVLTSPGLMNGVAELLKTQIYDHKHDAAEKALRDARQQLRVRRLQQEKTATPGATGSGSKTIDPADRKVLWNEYREVRKSLEARYPDLREAERSLRFKQRFFEEGGKPCPGGNLCGGGRDLKTNSALLLHLVTDELASAIGGEGMGERQWYRWLLTLLIPAVLVPVLFGFLALGLMLLIRWLAHVVSHLASKLLNDLTNAEVKRAAFGNDTEGETAVGAVDRPTWIEKSPPRLPVSIGDLVTAYSNGIASHSLAKFRRAIGQLASQEPKHTADSAITTYFTWKELVHASYFDVPEFRKLVAQAIARAEGFAPSARFLADPDFARTAGWLAEIEGPDGTTAKPGSQPPTKEDAEAVTTVVGTTVAPAPLT